MPDITSCQLSTLQSYILSFILPNFLLLFLSKNTVWLTNINAKHPSFFRYRPWNGKRGMVTNNGSLSLFTTEAAVD